MDIKIYILTYKNPKHLDANLESLFNSDLPSNAEINIINNHSKIFEIRKEYENNVNIHHQTLRANWGCGHPSRDWNQAIIHGFESLKNPKCKQLILCQDDTIWNKNWHEMLSKIHKTYTFYQCGWGDNFISVLPEAIQKIGLYDERMCALGSQEGDFLLRAWLYNRDKSSINDFHHFRVHNKTLDVAKRSDTIRESRNGAPYAKHSKIIFKDKWGIPSSHWDKHLFKYPFLQPLIVNYMFYPYFEYNIENLEEKGYLVNRDFL